MNEKWVDVVEPHTDKWCVVRSKRNGHVFYRTMPMWYKNEPYEDLVESNTSYLEACRICHELSCIEEVME